MQYNCFLRFSKQADGGSGGENPNQSIISFRFSAVFGQCPGQCPLSIVSVLLSVLLSKYI